VTRRLPAALLVAVALTLSACTASTSGTARSGSHNAATLPADQVATLQRMVAGVDHLALSLTRI
jgi:hypothetical protein